jgi:hypothetical protein
LEQQSIVYAKAEKTIIEGVVYYDVKRWATKVAIAKEQNELIGQLLQEKNKGANTQEPKKEKKEYHCDGENFNKLSIKNHNYLINYRQMNKHIYILVLALSLSILANAQQTPAPKQSNQYWF